MVATFTQETSGASGVVSFYSSDAAASSVSAVIDSPTGTFDITNKIAVTYVDSSEQVPNPDKTDDICCQIWSFYQTLNNPQESITNPQIPQVYFAIVPNPATVATSYFGPTSAPQQIVTEGITVEGTGETVQLFFSGDVPANFFLTPSEGLGETSYSQGSTTGRVLRTLPGSQAPTDVEATVGVELVDVEGTFNNEDAIYLNLDASQTIFNLIGNTELGYVTCPYEIKSETDLTTYSEFFDSVEALNAPYDVMQNHFVTFGVVSNLSTSKFKYTTLPQPNSQYILCASYPYPTTKSPAMLASQLGSTYAALISQPGIPQNPINGSVALGIFPNLDRSQVVDVAIGGSSERLMSRGWTAFSVNKFGQPYIVRAVTSLLSLPSGELDQEYFPVSVWQIVSLWKKTVYEVSMQTQYTNARRNKSVKRKLEVAIQGLAITFQDDGMFEGLTPQSVKQITVTDSLLDASGIVVNTPITIVPELNSIVTNVNIESALNVSVPTVG